LKKTRAFWIFACGKGWDAKRVGWRLSMSQGKVPKKRENGKQQFVWRDACLTKSFAQVMPAQ
jgi:hypothetical protein